MADRLAEFGADDSEIEDRIAYWYEERFSRADIRGDVESYSFWEAEPDEELDFADGYLNDLNTIDLETDTGYKGRKR